MWRGYLCTIQIVNKTARLIVDLNTRVLRSADFLLHLERLSHGEIAELIGASVIAPYGNYRMYKIEDIDKTMSPESKFNFNGEQITFKEYYERAYNISIKYMDQPLIVTLTKRRVINKNKEIEDIYEKIYLVPELVRLTGLTEDQRKDRGLMRKISQDPNKMPSQRMEANQKIIDLIKDTEIFSVDPEPLQVEGYELNRPDV